MNAHEQGLVRHLGLAILAKLIALAVLWWLFFSHLPPPAAERPAAPAAPNAASPRGETP